MELQVSRQTISKWEAGQSYPDFQRLVRLSDYFDMTLDELVKDIDVQDVREKSLTEKGKFYLFRCGKWKGKAAAVYKNILLYRRSSHFNSCSRFFIASSFS